MSGNIRLSPKHGLNPSMDMCFWCGQAIGIALLGRLPDDAEAPRQIVTSYEPCNKCKTDWGLGVAVFEATEDPIGNWPPIQDNLYPTGRFIVIKRDAAERIFGEQNIAKGKLFCDRQVFDLLTGPVIDYDTEKPINEENID